MAFVKIIHGVHTVDGGKKFLLNTKLIKTFLTVIPMSWGREVTYF